MATSLSVCEFSHSTMTIRKQLKRIWHREIQLSKIWPISQPLSCWFKLYWVCAWALTRPPRSFEKLRMMGQCNGNPNFIVDRDYISTGKWWQSGTLVFRSFKIFLYNFLFFFPFCIVQLNLKKYLEGTVEMAVIICTSSRKKVNIQAYKMLQFFMNINAHEY